MGLNCREDRVQLSRRSGSSVAIQSPGSNDPCIEPSGIRRLHEIRRNPRIPVYLAAFGKTSGHTTSGTHSRFTSHLRSYAQRQSVARETFQGRLGPIEQHAPHSHSGGALKCRGPCLTCFEPHPGEGAARSTMASQRPPKVASLRKQELKPGDCIYSGCISSRPEWSGLAIRPRPRMMFQKHVPWNHQFHVWKVRFRAKAHNWRRWRVEQLECQRASCGLSRNPAILRPLAWDCSPKIREIVWQAPQFRRWRFDPRENRAI